MSHTLGKGQLDFTAMVSAGLVDGYKSVLKYGERTTLSANEETLWAHSATPYAGFLTVAKKVRVEAGGNVADIAGGAGARTIMIEGLDADWNEISEILTLNGVGVSAESEQFFIRQLRTYVIDVGSYGATNVGPINVETVDGVSVMTHIPAAAGQTQQMIYSVPRGQVFIGTGVEISLDSLKDGTFRIYQRTNANDVVTFSATRKAYTFEGIDGGFPTGIQLNMPISFPEYTDLYMTIQSTQVGAIVHGSISGFTMPNR